MSLGQLATILILMLIYMQLYRLPQTWNYGIFDENKMVVKLLSEKRQQGQQCVQDPNVLITLRINDSCLSVGFSLKVH